MTSSVLFGALVALVVIFLWCLDGQDECETEQIKCELKRVKSDEEYGL